MTRAVRGHRESEPGSQSLPRTTEHDTVETKEFWSTLLDRLLKQRSRSRDELAAAKKSTPWKLEIAHELKRKSGASKRWLVQTLDLGAPAAR